MTRRVELLGEFKANQVAVRTLVGELAEEQLNWRVPGAWSIADCVEHLIQSNTMFGEAITAAIADPATPRGSSRFTEWLESWMVRLIEPPVRLKFKAPRQLEPNRRDWGPEILDAYVVSHRALLATIHADWIEIEKIRFRHPVRHFNMTVVAGLRAMAAHDRRHLWQARAAAEQYRNRKTG